jgi:hypothetical protein
MHRDSAWYVTSAIEALYDQHVTVQHEREDFSFHFL